MIIGGGIVGDEQAIGSAAAPSHADDACASDQVVCGCDDIENRQRPLHGIEIEQIAMSDNL